MEKSMPCKTVFKKGNQIMYAFLHTPDEMAGLISRCDLSLTLGMDGLKGSAQIFGEDPFYPDIIHFYASSNPRVTDPYRLFIVEPVRFAYREVT
jgi:hypothetical protein